MKKLLALLVPLILVLSCEQFDDSENFQSAEKILGKKEYAVHKGILTFRDKESFLKLSEELKDKTPQQLDEWESQNNFKSLRSLHEEAILKEEVFLQEMVVKYPNNTTLTRKELGYTPFTTNLINKGLFVVNEFETFDMNVTAPIYGAMVNTDGVFRVGDVLVIPQLNVAKFLKNGDASKLSMLRNATTTDETKGIEVNEIARSSFKKSQSENGRTKAWTSCDDSNDGYRLIVYEEVYEGNVLPDEIPCYGAEASYWLRFRSLKRVFGTWQNHNTSLWYVYSTVKIEHWARCDYSDGQTPTNYSYFATPVNYTDYRSDLPYGNNVTRYFLLNYELGPCNSGGFNTCPPDFYGSQPDPLGVLYYLTRIHYAYGKGGTYCYVGE